jgi:hypothetical protein
LIHGRPHYRARHRHSARLSRAWRRRHRGAHDVGARLLRRRRSERGRGTSKCAAGLGRAQRRARWRCGGRGRKQVRRARRDRLIWPRRGSHRIESGLLPRLTKQRRIDLENWLVRHRRGRAACTSCTGALSLLVGPLHDLAIDKVGCASGMSAVPPSAAWQNSRSPTAPTRSHSLRVATSRSSSRTSALPCSSRGRCRSSSAAIASRRASTRAAEFGHRPVEMFAGFARRARITV